MKELDVENFMAELSEDPKAVLIDVRSPEEEVEGKIENSVNMNVMDQSFPAKVMDLEKNNNYYVYCRSGARSATACKFMNKQGLNAVNLKGGIMAWKALNNEC